MRITFAVAVACFSLVAVTTGKEAEAAMRRQTNIAAQGLAPALKILANERDVQLVYRAEIVGDHQTSGAAGDLTFEEALTQLLSGTGLTYRYLDNNAITIVPVPTASSSPVRARGEAAAGETRFRVARVDQGRNPGASGDGAKGANRTDSAMTRAESSRTTLEEVVVTASKRSEEISKVGGGVSAISGTALEERSANSLQDYIAFIPGVVLQSRGTPGFGTISIRGVAPQSVGATTATYIDEIPVGPSSALTRGALYGVDLDPSDLERVEVLKGPQGTLYGASSMGGIVKYVTRGPSLTDTEFNTSEDFNTIAGGSPGMKVRGSVSAPLIEGELGMRFSAYYRHDGGYIDDLGVGGEDMNRSNDKGGRATLLYKPIGDLTIKLNATIQDTASLGYSTADYNRTTWQPVYGEDEKLRYAGEGFDLHTKLYSAEVNYNMGKLDLVSASSYSHYQPTGRSDLTTLFTATGSGGVTLQTPVQSTSVDDVKMWTQEIRLVSQRMGIVEWMLGGFYQHESLKDGFIYQFTQTDTNLGKQLRNGTLAEYAGFANATIYLLPQFDLTLGYRNSTLDQTRNAMSTGKLYNAANPAAVTASSQVFSEHASTYLAALRYRLTDNVLLYGRAASGYRPGGGRAVPPTAPPGYKNYFTSDSLWSYETGLKMRQLEDRLTIDTAAFWINWKNIQQLEPIPGTATVTDGNAGNAVSRGFEFQAAYVPLKGLTVGVNGAFTQAKFTQAIPLDRITNGERLFYVPKWTAAAYSEYSRPVMSGWDGFVGGDYQYQSERLDINRTPMPGYSTWNIRTGLRSDHYRVSFYVNNLTNKLAWLGYLSGGLGAVNPYVFAVNQPRTFGITFAQNF